MKSEGLAKPLLVAFLAALAGYVVCYAVIEHRRTRNGPWAITFTQRAEGVPAIVINHLKLGITNVALGFPGQRAGTSNAPATTLLFAQARPVPFAVPFGKCVFQDATFLPGTVTLQLFGHEIELLPRVLVIDRQEHPWRSNQTLTAPGP